MPLTDARIRAEKPGNKPTKLTDSHGLFLEVRPSGAKLWRYRYRIAGKENLFALGEYWQPSPGEPIEVTAERKASARFTLSEARQERDRCRGLVKQGIHPARHRKTEKATHAAQVANTFEAVAREWLSKRQWTPRHHRQVVANLERDVFSYIGTLPIRQVTPAHILEILQRAEQRGAVTIALMQRQWISAVFRYAIATLRAESDPAAALKGALTQPKVTHHKPLSRADIPRLFEAMDNYKGLPITVIALKLLLYTFVRPGELRQAQWEEFDLDAGEWRIPAERMKMGDVHIVPLSVQAVDLLQNLSALTGSQRWLFPNTRQPRNCMSITTLNRALERMGFNGVGTIGFSAHGFRATASTMLNEMSYRVDVIERQLAHKERNQSRASYNRAEYLEERRSLMHEWAIYLDGLATGADVLQFRIKPKHHEQKV